MRSLVTVLCLFCLWLSTAAAETDQAEWQVLEKADGIQLYSSSVTDTGILKLKAVAVIDADISRIKAVIDNAAHYPEWMPYLIETRVLEQQSTTEQLLYSRFDATWPARDRDLIYRVSVIQHEDGSISYQQQSQLSALMPVQDEYVRATLMQGGYQLTPVDGNQTQVEMLLHADPHGKLPLWITNVVQQRLVFESLQGLIKRLAKAE